MMLRTILVFFLLFVIVTSAQNKYFVYFTDKGESGENLLNKKSNQYQTAISYLSQRAIERRKKALGEQFISYEDLPLSEKYIKQVESTGAKIVWKLKWFNAVSCYLSDKQYQVVKNFEFVDRVERVNTIRYDRDEKIDESFDLLKPNNMKAAFDYGSSFSQNNICDVPALHDKNINGENVIVALLDAGFLWENHPAFSQIDVIAEFDFVYNDEDVGNDNDASHGTAVLSIAGGFAEGALIGPAYNAKYILAKTEDIRSETHVEEDNFVRALEWVESLGADIVSTSLGYNLFDQGEDSYTYDDMDGNTTIITRAFEKTFDKGVVTITSAGNEGDNSWFYITAPADGENVISVGAVHSNNALTGFSSRGPTSDGRIKPEVLAQGTGCYYADVYSSGYFFGTGTSYAAPIVAGIAAQLLSVYPHLNNRQVRSIFLQSGDNADNPDNERGYGLLSAKRAVTFPNVEFDNGQIIIHKTILDELDTESVIMLINMFGDDFMHPIPMQTEDGVSFTASLPSSYSTGDTVLISFEWTDLNGESENDPGGDYYGYIYGSEFISLGTFDGPVNNTPVNYALYQNYPNPFNAGTKIEYDVNIPTNVKIKIFNVLGEHVKTLFSGFRGIGRYQLVWDGRDQYGRFVSSGVYLYVLQAGDFLTSKKMIYLK